MNILHISSAMSWRGGEQQITYLLEELASQGHNCYLMYPVGAPIGDKEVVVKSCTLIPYKKRFAVNPLVPIKIANTVKKYAIDIVHAHDSHAHTFVWLYSKFYQRAVPAVVSRRVDFPISKSSYNKYTHPNIKKIICVSDKIKDVVCEGLKLSDRVVTVRSGVDLSKFETEKSFDLYAKFKIPTDHKIVANISAVASHKDYSTFVEVACKVLDNHDKVTFLIIGGDDGEGEMIYNLIQQKGYGHRIIMTGYIENAFKLLSQIDVFLFPSKMEGLGTSLLDAAAAKVPIVTTYAGGIPEVVEHNITGLMANVGDSALLADHVLRLLDDFTLADRLTTEGLANVSKFSKINTATKTLSIYKSVI